jgi:hypothetical protein
MQIKEGLNILLITFKPRITIIICSSTNAMQRQRLIQISDPFRCFGSAFGSFFAFTQNFFLKQGVIHINGFWVSRLSIITKHQ